MNWKNLFYENILLRGKDYYINQHVKKISVNNHLIEATVEGEESYHVIIKKEDHQIKSMSCTCPFASEGHNCKHMAAVLFSLDNRIESDNAVSLYTIPTYNDEYAYKLDQVKNLVEQADKSLIKEYLVSFLMDDQNRLLRFHSAVNHHTSKEDLKSYFQQVDQVTNEATRYGYIEYNEVYSFINKMETFIDEDVQDMIQRQEYTCAFELLNHIFMILGNTEMDSQGEDNELAKKIYQLWIEIIHKASKDEQNEMFMWFVENLDGSVIDYLQEYIEKIVINEFNDEEYQDTKLYAIYKIIHKIEKEEACDWYKKSYMNHWILEYLKLLFKYQCSKKKTDQFVRKYWKYSAIRKYFIHLYMNEAKYDLVLKILDESIRLDKEETSLVKEYQHQKKEIYLLQGNHDSYIKQLYNIVCFYDVGNFDAYLELKKQYSKKQWCQRREEIFDKIKRHVDMKKFYEEEKLDDRLYECIMKEPGLSSIRSYKTILKDHYSKEILEKYKKEVDQLALHTTGRKTYHYLVCLLREMKEIKGGNKMVEEISHQWQIKYNNRPAMMDELQHL